MSYMDTDNPLFSGGASEQALTQIGSAMSLGQAVAKGTSNAATQSVVDILQQQRPEVKQVLAFELRLVKDLPELVVTTIAKSDDPSVSVPFLEVSPSVTEDIILSIVEELDGSAQNAVARRSDVTDAIADALVEQGNQKVALTLARNDKVEISRDILERIVAKYPDDTRILKSATHAISRIQEAVSATSTLPFNVLMSRARAFAKNGMLSGEYLLKLLAQNGLNEFEAALCVLSDLNRKDVRKLVMHSNETRVDLEHACNLAPGILSGNADAIQKCYAAVLKSPKD